MDADSSTTEASDENLSDNADGSSNGDTGGTQTDASALAPGDKEQYESRIRSFQSEKDRAVARANELERQLASRSGNGDQGDGAGFDPDTAMARLEQRFEHRATMRDEATALRGNFPYADGDLFGRAHEFDSPEALRAAVEASHARVQSYISAEKTKWEESQRARLAEHGIRLDSPADSNGTNPSGEPTLAEFATWTFADQSAYERDNPGFTDRLLRTANPAQATV